MKQVLAYIFLIIFSFQCLPVKAIGKVLAKNQLNEEVKQDCNSEDLVDDDDILPDLFCASSNQDILSVVKDGEDFRNYHSLECHLPNWHIKDIHCPPPNY
ncbi:MAG: hypothetical protein IAE95_07745 [Chitinophagaceae bacterium]|nr:hypothetical protein [Chitinophagaceae bacterium]